MREALWRNGGYSLETALQCARTLVAMQWSNISALAFALVTEEKIGLQIASARAGFGAAKDSGFAATCARRLNNSAVLARYAVSRGR
jgi:hypothetical protein